MDFFKANIDGFYTLDDVIRNVILNAAKLSVSVAAAIGWIVVVILVIVIIVASIIRVKHWKRTKL